jgi:predicted dehydrogenase
MNPDAQRSPLPQRPRPIVMIGAGGIVVDGHLPAYRKAGFQVAGITDLNLDKARKVAADWGIPVVHADLAEAIRNAPPGAVFDLALPASANLAVLEQLPEGAAVLIQKPMGENLDQARAIRECCRRRNLKAAVNFQLRYAPYVLGARHLIQQAKLGQIHDLEVRVTVFTPWHLWTFLEGIPRVEILYHSVHYIDLVRSFLGDPSAIYAKTMKHPKTTRLASTRSTLILDYGDLTRATITVNHGHEYGLEHQESYVKWECTDGAVKARLGLLMNYPKGEPDELAWCRIGEDGTSSRWTTESVEGSWFPDAFIGTMSSLQRYCNGETADLPTGVEDAFATMAVVEAAYQSSSNGGTPIPRE